MALSLTARKVATRVGARAFSAKAALPDLAYDYAALEPHVSAQIMEVCVYVCVERVTVLVSVLKVPFAIANGDGLFF